MKEPFEFVRPGTCKRVLDVQVAGLFVHSKPAAVVNFVSGMFGVEFDKSRLVYPCVTRHTSAIAELKQTIGRNRIDFSLVNAHGVVSLRRTEVISRGRV